MIPDFQSLMRPLLDYASDGYEHAVRDALGVIAEKLKLSDADLKEVLPSGQERTYDNRVRWAVTHLKKAGLLESPGRGLLRITPRGTDAFQQAQVINMKFLRQFDEYAVFTSSKRLDGALVAVLPNDGSEQSPDESIAIGYQQLRDELAGELLAKVKACPPDFFERLVVELLVKMGYGGSRVDAGKALGKSGDGGIDGSIKEDKLGLDIVYVQAKRWDNGPVGRPEIQKFAGALAGQRARKGIFIASCDFTKEAQDYVTRIETRIVLINGIQLAQLMIDHGVGVSTVATYEIKRIDLDYFVDG